MPTIYKVLGQLLPASTSGDLYATPASTDTVVSTINAVNTGTTTADISIAVRPAGATIETKHYIVRSLPVAAKAVFTYTAGVTLDATDVITVESTTSNVAFSAFGSEIS